MDPPQHATFAALLRRARDRAGLTQEQLAERAALSVRGLVYLERAVRRPYRATVRRLAAALALPPQEEALFVAAACHLDDAAARRARADAGTAAGPLLPPFIGRAGELALLEQHLTGGTNVPLLLLAGEPGIGKSRLLQDTMRRGGERGWHVLQGGCTQRDGQEPYAPLLEALERDLHGVSATRRRAILHGCAWLIRLLPELGAGPIEPLPSWTVTPAQERRLMFDAVARFLANVAGPAGTLLVLDDLQWAGRDALDLLRMLTHAAAEHRLRVVGAYRDTEGEPQTPLAVLLADLAHAGLATQRTLAPLARAEAALLLTALLQNSPAEARERVLRRAGGVPFFLVSCAQAVPGDPTTWGALDEGDTAGGVPWTVAQSLRQRLAALPPVARDLLAVAAVAGRETSRVLLTHVAARPEGEMLAALESACRAHLLEEAGPAAYRFPHDVIREVVEDALGAARRVLLHRDIAQALEWLPGEPPVEEVAYHYAHTEEHARAAEWLERAGDQAAAGVASAAALEHYTAARAHLAASCADVAALSRLDEKAGDRRLLLGQYAQAQEDFALACAEATAAVRRAELACKEGLTWEKQGEFARALAAFDRAAAGGEDGTGASLPLRVQAAIELGRGDIHYRQGDAGSALAAARRASALLSAESPTRDTGLVRAGAEALEGLVAGMWGDLGQAEACHGRSLALREHLGDQQGSADSLRHLGNLAFLRSDHAMAEDCYRRGLAIAERLGDQEGIALCWQTLAGPALWRGDLARAEECNRRALAIHERSGHPQGMAAACGDLGYVTMMQGDLAQAEAWYRRALALWEHVGHPPGIAGTCRLLGLVALHAGELGKAEEQFQRSLADYAHLHDQGGRVAVSLNLGGLRLVQGDLDGAEEYFQSVHSGAEAMGLEDWITVSGTHLGQVALERSDLRAAVRWFRLGRRRAQRSEGLGGIEAVATLGQGQARLRAGRLRAAAALIAHGRALATQRAMAAEILDAALLTAELCLRQGRLTEAYEAAEDARRRAMGAGRHVEGARSRRLAGQCALARGDASGALAYLRAALATLTESGAALEAARTCLVLAEALAACADTGGIPQEARALLAAAQGQFAVSGAALDLAQAEQVTAAWKAR